jgi:steroid delta-isomerase-like uncharacterized protein
MSVDRSDVLVTPPPQSSESSTAANEAVVRRFVDEVLNAHNAAAADDVLAPDHILNYMLLPEPMVGAKAWEQSVQNYFTAFPDMKVTIDDFVSQGDKVAARWTATATHTGPLMGIPPTGRQVTWIGMGVYRIVDGKIAEQWGIDDALGLMQRIGAIPSGGGDGGSSAGQ